MTDPGKKSNKFYKSETVTNLLWTSFGIITGLTHYSKNEYLLCIIMFIVGILYAYKLIKSLIKQRTDNFPH